MTAITKVIFYTNSCTKIKELTAKGAMYYSQRTQRMGLTWRLFGFALFIFLILL